MHPTPINPNIMIHLPLKIFPPPCKNHHRALWWFLQGLEFCLEKAFLAFWGHFWPRAMLKGPKRSFVVVVFLGGLESWAKNFQNGTKMFQMEQRMCANKNFYKGTKKFRSGKILLNEYKTFMELYKVEWIFVAQWEYERKVLSSVAH